MKTVILTFSLTLLLFSCSSAQKQTKVSHITGTAARLGEGSIWDFEHGFLYWIDIQGKKYHTYHPSGKRHQTYEMGKLIGTIVPESEHTAIVALQDGVYRHDRRTDKLEFLGKPSSLGEDERFNDGKCDPAGRLWVGSMKTRGKSGGSFLYRMDADNNFTEMIGSVSISNGIAWSLDGTKMYYIDTPTRKVMEYQYSAADGSISQARIAVMVADSLGHPDGMTIDSGGKLWVAMWGGSSVCQFDPENGRLLQRIMVPARNVTSCAFGGKKLDQLFITTAMGPETEEEKSRFPNAGGLFVCIPGVKGVPGNAFR